MFDRLIERATEFLMNWCVRKGRVLNITGTGGPDDIYLIRYYLVKSRFFNVFIHQFLRSDRDDLHDHPWHFATYLVRGAYTEHKWSEKLGEETVTRRQSGSNQLIFYRNHGNYRVECMEYNLHPMRFEPENRLVFRRATDQHKVLTDHHYAFSERRFAPLTICVTGPTIRTWGFIRRVYQVIAESAAEIDTCVVGRVKKDRKSDPDKIRIIVPGNLNKFRVYRYVGRKWVDWREYLGLPPDEPGRG